jgi:hypothetical protein
MRVRRTRRSSTHPRPDILLGPRIALWGLFDVADYRSLLVPRILERELRSRLPCAQVDIYAPLGSERPIPLDGGRAALALGEPTRHRKRQLAERHDLIVVVGDVVHVHDDAHREVYGRSDLRPSDFFVDGLGDDLEPRCPLAWSGVGVPFDPTGADVARLRAALARRAHVSVRDELSRKRLLALGGEHEIRVVPEATVVAPRAFPPDVLHRRLEYLRALRSFPERGRAVLVDHEQVDVAAVVEIGRHDRSGRSCEGKSRCLAHVRERAAAGVLQEPRAEDDIHITVVVGIDERGRARGWQA